MLFLDEELKIIGRIRGYQTPRQLEPFLKGFARNDYKQWRSNEDVQAYTEEFVHEFIE
jgi:hypothetical protein